MQDIVSANNLRIRIGQQRECVAPFLRLASANLRWIYADADDANAARLELRQPLLETPQLGVAERSPKTTIKYQHGTLGVGKQIAEANRFSVLIQQ